LKHGAHFMHCSASSLSHFHKLFLQVYSRHTNTLVYQIWKDAAPEQNLLIKYSPVNIPIWHVFESGTNQLTQHLLSFTMAAQFTKQTGLYRSVIKIIKLQLLSLD